MKLILITIVLCCIHQSDGVTSTITNLAIQDYWINRQIAENKLTNAGRHRQQTIGPVQAIGFDELFQIIEAAQMVVDARHRCEKRCSRNCRKFGPKVGKCNKTGTMDKFRQMQELASSYAG